MRKMSEYVIISDSIRIPLGEIELSAIRAQGAGGQHVNTASTAIHLRFDAGKSPSLPDDVRGRLLALGDRRISADGMVVIKAQEHRIQERNRQAALERLADLIRSVLEVPPPRRPTRPTKAAQEQRLEDKHHRGMRKRGRGRVCED